LQVGNPDWTIAQNLSEGGGRQFRRHFQRHVGGFAVFVNRDSERADIFPSFQQLG
jgi:hypothetical protein